MIDKVMVKVKCNFCQAIFTQLVGEIGSNSPEGKGLTRPHLVCHNSGNFVSRSCIIT